MKHRLRLMAMVAVAVSGFACTKARTLVDDPRACPNWEEQIKPLFDQKCLACHAPTSSQGGYDVSRYDLAVGTGPVPDIVVGDANSKLLTTLDPASATGPHAGMADVYALAKTWVVECRASFLNEANSVHTAGVMNRTQADFHGKTVIDANYDLRVCQSCHGQLLDGGKSKVPCTSCHSGLGAKACGSCHGYPPATGAHQIHAGGGVLAKTVDCATCHPDHRGAGDHAYAGNGLRTGPAQVVLSGLAALTPGSGKRAGAPAWDAKNRTCSNVYCHGATTPDSKTTTASPSWDAPHRDASQTCTYCHGLPPNGAGGTKCATCHRSVVDPADSTKLVSTALHLDGKVDFAEPGTACNTCHGSASSMAPPPDLQGNSATSSVGVGLHQRHLSAPVLGLRGPIQCSECHLVPTNVSGSAHFGAGHAPGTVMQATVFPSGAGWGALARAESAQPKWNHDTATCSGVYCHGGGEPLNTDSTAGVLQTPNWVNPDAGECGSTCHGIPPRFNGHPTGATRTTCVACHAKTIDSAGKIVFTGPAGAQTTTHMNGAFDGN
jgi:predicted CxxxxCH...CXXCH cytochrome family protein